MIAIGHTSVGVILGTAATQFIPPLTLNLPIQIILVGAAGLASHYLMDIMPHGHYEFDQKQISNRQKLYFSLDFILPILIIAFYLLTTHGFDRVTWLIGAGILGAQLPDVLMGLRNKNMLPNWNLFKIESHYHSQTHWHNPKDASKATTQGGRKLGLSDTWQLIVGIIATILLIKF